MVKAKAHDPNYSQLRGHVPNRLAARFKAICTHRGIDFGTGMEEALQPWIEKEEKRLQMPSPSSSPATLAELVKAYYFDLSEAEVLNIRELAKGAEPIKADILRIAKALNRDYNELLILALKSFPDSIQLRSIYTSDPIDKQEKEPNGAT